MSGECVTSSVVLPQQRFEMADQCYSSVTAQLFLASKGKYTLNAWGWADSKGEASIRLGFLLLYIGLLPTPWACPMQNGLAKKGLCLFHLKFSLLSLWIFFCSIFVGFSLFCLLGTVILDSVFLFQLPNIPLSRDGRPNSSGIGAWRSLWLHPAELGWWEALGSPSC